MAVLVIVAGALVGLVVGLLSAVVISSILWNSDGADEPFMLGILLVVAVVVPIAMLVGAAVALRLYRDKQG